jgi:xanthosine phosphorylase
LEKFMTEIEKSAKIIQEKAETLSPRLAVMLGSGLGAVADLIEEICSVPYAELPGFPRPTVAGHEGSIKIGHVGDTAVYFLKGRQHLYEGEGAQGLKTIIRTLKTLGVTTLFLTNAAGSARAEYPPGSVVAITDHINLTGTNPLIGPNDDNWGPRFPDMHNAWDSELRENLIACAKEEDIKLGTGIYACFLGPTFETPAEVSFAKTVGADLVGMSTVAENIIARHCGMKCVGVSAVTNLAAGMSDVPLSHDQTLEGAALAEKNMARLVKSFIINTKFS